MRVRRMQALIVRVILVSGCVLSGGLAVSGCDLAPHESTSPSHSETEADGEIQLAPGYGRLDFAVPEPGTYELPPLGDAGDGALLASDGSRMALHDLLGEKVVILSLMYASCSDVNGCPLATAVLHQIASRMEKDEELAGGLRLLSLSFDPERDTPEVMKQYGSHHSGHGIDWQFMTTSSSADLRPILKAYGQSLVPEIDEDGNEIGAFSHLLRVFLIDPARRIRNIYSVSYLHADTLISDVKTLQLEAKRTETSHRESQTIIASSRPGDPRSGYSQPDFKTNSLSLTARRGRRIDLVERANAVQLGLPKLLVPEDNQLTPEKVALGRALFFDRRLSLNSTLSCAMCHVPEQGFANNELATAVGIEGRTVRRNAPTILNIGFADRLFHDARENRLEYQVWGPLLARNEMGNPSVGAVIEKIRGIGDYEALFTAAFPDRGLEIETIGMAIASYERTLVSGGSAFDHWLFGGDEAALGAAEIDGYELFVGKAGCVRCHRISSDTALLTDGQLHNTGIGYRSSMSEDEDEQSLQLAPGKFVAVRRGLIAEVSEPSLADLGLYEITQNPDDRWKYKTPSLRNVGLTAPYMHDGSLATLREVVEFYSRGGVGNPLLDGLIRPLDLADAEIEKLVSFLESLTGGDVGQLIADGFAAPVGDFVEEGHFSSIE